LMTTMRRSRLFFSARLMGLLTASDHHVPHIFYTVIEIVIRLPITMIWQRPRMRLSSSY